MARRPSGAAYGLDALLQHPCLYVAFPPPRARKLDPLVLVVRQVKTQAHGPCDLILFSGPVLKPRASGNGVLILENGVQKDQVHLKKPVAQSDLQGIRLILRLHIGGRQPFKLWLPLIDLVGYILKIRDPAAVLLGDLQGRHTEIRGPVGRILLL